MLRLPFSLLSWLVALAAADTVTVSVSATAPSDVSSTIPPNFVAFAFEERSFYYVAGPSGSPNVFSQNLINAVANRTNTRPCIRVGGTSLERSVWDAAQSEALVVPADAANEKIPIGISIGPSFFDSFNNFPTAQYVFDIPMGKKTTTDDSSAFALAGWNTIGADNIMALEPGNEPNSYGSGYTSSTYATEFETYSSAIASALGISLTDPRWQVGSTGSGAGEAWNATALFADGLDTVMDRILSYSAHYYQYSTLGQLDVETNLMNHNNIVNKLEAFLGEGSYLAGLSPPLPFNLAEVGCGLGTLSDGTAAGEASFGAALWQVDFMLYTMSNGVHRVNMQTGLGFEFSQFQPVEWLGTSAAVFASYYASLFAADFIGTSAAAQSINIDLDSASMSAYAVYESGSLARVALVNFNFYNGSAEDAGTRGSQTFSVQVPDLTQDNVTVMALTSDLGASAVDSEDITWAGQSWNEADQGLVSGTMSTSTVTVSNGVASIEVMDSEAVMVVFKAEAFSTATTSVLPSSTGTSSTTAMGTSTSVGVLPSITYTSFSSSSIFLSSSTILYPTSMISSSVSSSSATTSPASASTTISSTSTTTTGSTTGTGTGTATGAISTTTNTAAASRPVPGSSSVLTRGLCGVLAAILNLAL